MGCATSKLDDLPAVALCRQRCTFLDEALRQRYAFAEAHAAYLHSLKAVGLSLHRFFNQDLDNISLLPSPLLNLPPHRKGEDPAAASIQPPAGSPNPKIHHHIHSRSDSGDHLHFHSDSDEDDASSSDPLHHHHDANSPPHQQHHPYGGGYDPDYGSFNFNPAGAGAGAGAGAAAGGGGFMNISYMKKQTTPSVVYTQRPMSGGETMHMMGESSASSSSYYPYPNYSNKSIQNHNPPPYLSYSMNNNYQNYDAGGGFFGGPAPSNAHQAVASSSKAPPPPPSPPESSSWDFLNPFETFEKYYPAYTPSHDSKEVREEEGIPDLEDEDDEVVVKEVHQDQKFVNNGRSNHSKPTASEENAQVVSGKDLHHGARPSLGSDPVYEVHMVQKNGGDAERSKSGSNSTEFKPHGGFKGDLEVVKEIQVQFERASDSGSELAKFLEVGKLQYKGKHVSSRILHLPMASTSRSSDNADPDFLEIDQEMEQSSKNLSSTLHKLHLWEKKLYDEVKVEEKMRVLHERKSKKLKHLDERGAEAHKVNETRTFVRSLSTKIKIAIQVVDKMSVKINSLRDDELWPQLNQFIQGLSRMWKSMLECHQTQCQAIGEAKRLDAIAKHFNDAHFEATRQLEHDLIKWTLAFSFWVGAQKGFVRALNNWLMKCLLYVPEETADGIAPFSPGRIGAPQVFVICHQWSQSLDRISEKEVVDSMRDFASNVLQLWDRDKAEMRQRILANKDERKIKSLEKEDQKIQKEIQALDKKMVLISADGTAGQVVYQSETTKGGSLQASLQHVLVAIEKFTSNSLKVYEELLQRIEEETLVREHEKVS